MRILVHDFGAYAFSIQLSRELARRGHTVRYVYLDEAGSVRGDVRLRPSDPADFSSVGLVDVDPRRRHSFVRRLLHDARYSAQISDEVRAFQPDVVLSADCPLLSQWSIQKACREVGASFSFWLQDLFGEALNAVLSRKNDLVGTIVSTPFRILEHRLLRASDHVLAIAPAFVDYVISAGVAKQNVHLLPNWAPMKPIPATEERWGKEFGLPEGKRVLYSGTLGLKHDPMVLVESAKALADSNGHVVVISEGVGRQFLEQAKAEGGLDNLYLLDFQPERDLSRVFASANILIAILNSDASVFSIPSKVLAYMPMARPIVAVMPASNFAAHRLLESGGGLVVDPTDREEVSKAILQLIQDPATCDSMGAKARQFAEHAFSISRITDELEQMCDVIDITDAEIDLTPVARVNGAVRQ